MTQRTLPWEPASFMADAGCRDRRDQAKGRQVRGKHTQEFQLEAVGLVKAGQSVGMTAKVLGIPMANG